MRTTIIQKLEARFNAYADLMAQTDAPALEAKLEVEKHKSLKEHLWCVVGARQSYAKALEANEWQGFSCGMTNFEPADFQAALADSAADVLKVLHAIEDWTEEREGLLATLAEHEVMHEGQIIRHLYGVGSSAPASWTWA